MLADTTALSRDGFSLSVISSYRSPRSEVAGCGSIQFESGLQEGFGSEARFG